MRPVPNHSHAYVIAGSEVQVNLKSPYQSGIPQPERWPQINQKAIGDGVRVIENKGNSLLHC